MANKYLDAIQRIRKWLPRDPHLVAYEVREWPATKESGLDDLAWSMCRDGSVSINDTKYLLDKLEAYLLREDVEDE